MRRISAMFLHRNCVLLWHNLVRPVAILQLQRLAIHEGSKIVQDANENVTVEVVQLSGNKLVDDSVYYKARGRLDMFAIMTSRKTMGRISKSQDRATKRAQVQRS